MSRTIKTNSLLSALLLGAVSTLPAAVSAEILAHKQLRSMFVKSDGRWHLEFVEWLENTGSATEENVQIIADLSPLGNAIDVSVISAEPHIQVESNGSLPVTGEASVNSAFNGLSDRDLLLSGAILGGGEILRVTYSVDADLGAGVIELQSIAQPGGDLSNNGENDFNSIVNLDTPTRISQPATATNAAAVANCGAGKIESSYNLIKNGDFSTVTGILPLKNDRGDNIPNTITSSANELLANSFFSDSPYAGDNTFATDNNINGDFGSFPFVNGISIQQTKVGAGITLFSGSTFQAGFPGDVLRNVPAADNFLLYNGNTSNQIVDIWKQQVSGLVSGDEYHFIVYLSNAEWPGNDVQPLPSIQLLATNAEGDTAQPIDVKQESAANPDTWSPFSTIISPVNSDPVGLSIADGTGNTLFGDHLALAQIGLFKCSVGSEDDDQDGLTNLEEKNLGTNPDSSDTDGDGLPDISDEDPAGIEQNKDSDNDGVSDVDELEIGSDPNDADSDGDGILDGTEFGKPLEDFDADGDGIHNILESSVVNPNGVAGAGDEDGDGIADQFDFKQSAPSNSGGTGGGSTGWLLFLLPLFYRFRKQR